MTDGEQQCSVLHAISGDIDGIIHRHSLTPAARGSGVDSFRSFSQRAVYWTPITSYTLFLDKKKNPMIHFFVSSTLIYSI